MTYLCLNPRELTTKAHMLAHIKDQLGFDPDTALNLDALYDMLTTHFQRASILCLDYRQGENSLYPFAQNVYQVIAEAALVNRALRVDVVSLPAL